MVKALLIRGMLAGVIAGILAFGFARIFGEPEIDYAIGFEEQLTSVARTQAHATGAAHEHEEDLVSRDIQAGIGLLTAAVVYGAGIGGLFAIVFAFAYGRLGHLGPRATAALLAAAGFVSIEFVPFLKYPANPPSVGSAETLGSRTALFLIMIAISIAAIVFAIGLARWFVVRKGPRASAALGALAFIVIVGIAQLILPDVREVPTEFSADSLWCFRAASLGMQMLMWATLGIAFSALSARLLNQPNA